MSLQASVIIDAYNYGQFIESAIQSVLNQTFPRNCYEIIVVDDGSTDDTAVRVQKFGNQVRYFKKENGGQASAFNVGIEHAQGDFIFFLDADDCWVPEKLQRVMVEFERFSDTGLVLHSRRVVWDQFERLEHIPEFHNEPISEKLVGAFQKIGFCTSTVGVRKSSLNQILPFPNELQVSADVYFMSLLWVTHVSHINEPLVTYRIHGGNWYSNRDPEKMKRSVWFVRRGLECVKNRISSFPNYNPALFEALVQPYWFSLEQIEMKRKILVGENQPFDLFRMELKQMKSDWKQWNFAYKIYKLARLPLYAILPSRLMLWLIDIYTRMNLARVRNLVFPLRRR